MKTILVPLDGSQVAELGLSAATMMAKATGSALVLFTAVRSQSEDAETSAGHGPARDYLQQQQQRLVAEGVAVTTELVHDDPVSGILGAADTHHADLISMSTHGSTGLRHLRFGSVTQSVLRRSHKPVLVTRDPLPHQPQTLKRILVPLDHSVNADSILTYVADQQLAVGAEVILLQVLEEALVAEPAMLSGARIAEISRQAMHEVEPQRDEASNYLNGLGQKYLPKGTTWRSETSTGLPPEEILSFARSHQVDLIVMSIHPHHGIEKLVHTSTTMTVLHQAEMPVLLVPAATH